MSRSTHLRWVPHTELPCPVPDLLVEGCWESPAGRWWAGTLPGAPGSRVLWVDGHRLDVTGPSRLDAATARINVSRRGGPPQVRGDLPSGPVTGTLEQPGRRGLRGVVSFTRGSHRVLLQAEGQADLWLRARGVFGADVRTSDGRRVAALSGGRDLVVQDAASPDEQVLGVLLLTAVAREDITPVGNA